MDIEGNLRSEGALGFTCAKDCNTCFNCSCDEDGMLSYGNAGCTRKSCGKNRRGWGRRRRKRAADYSASSEGTL